MNTAVNLAVYIFLAITLLGLALGFVLFKMVYGSFRRSDDNPYRYVTQKTIDNAEHLFSHLQNRLHHLPFGSSERIALDKYVNQLRLEIQNWRKEHQKLSSAVYLVYGKHKANSQRLDDFINNISFLKLIISKNYRSELNKLKSDRTRSQADLKELYNALIAFNRAIDDEIRSNQHQGSESR